MTQAGKSLIPHWVTRQLMS